MKMIAFESVSLADAKRVHDGPPPRGWGEDWTSRRSAGNAAEVLGAATAAWINTLPVALRPLGLAGRFVRIANRIGSLWGNPARCAAYLSDLMIVRRAKRRGFPADIAAEINRLAAHYETLHPPGRGWTGAR